MITYLDVLDQLALGHYHTGSLVAANQWQLCWDWPIAEPRMEISEVVSAQILTTL